MLDGIFEGEEGRAIKTAMWAVGIGLAIRLIWHHSTHRSTIPLAQRINRSDSVNASYRVPLQRGWPGTKQTLEVMAQIVRRDHGDPVIRALAERIVERCGGHDFQCQIRALHQFVRDQITFRRDPVDIERVQDSRRVLQSRVGDCDDKSVLLCSLLGSLGHRTRFGLCSNKPGDFSHVFVECLGPGGWITLDPTPENYRAGQRAHARYYGNFAIFGK